jgi:hypothetical protein
MAGEQRAREEAQKDTKNLSRVVKELKKMTEQLSSYVPSVRLR